MSAYWDTLTETEFTAEIDRTLHGDKPTPAPSPAKKRRGKKKRVTFTVSETEEVTA